MNRSGIALGFLTVALAAALVSREPAQDARLSGASREPARNGWTLVHLKGSPGQVGFQHGYLLAPEIEDAVRVVAAGFEHDTKRGWQFFREAARTTFWPHVEAEYREELEGIAAGLAARGVKLDVWDVTALNAMTEFVPYYVAWYDKAGPQPPRPERCSAFIATGSYTKDGRPVIAHNAWTGYMEGQRWSMIFDIQPARGHRILMDGYPGLIHSGDDFGMNDAGILITETTISQFHGGFDPNGVPEFVRARKAMQYAGSIDEFARLMTRGNNGGYANNWLIADRKTGEIASLELGFTNVNLRRTKDGYFAGSNFPVNPQLIKEETNFNPEDLSTSPTARRIRWEQLMAEHKGKIDLRLAQSFLSDHYDTFAKKEEPNERTLCGHIDLSPRGSGEWQPPYGTAGAVQAKATTAAMAEGMKLTASMGHSCGIHFNAARHLEEHPEFLWQKPFLRDVPSQPWTEFAAKRSDKH